MGTTAHVVVVAPSPGVAAHLAAAAQQRVLDLERLWSRFLPASELSRLNAHAGGNPQAVSEETFRVVALAVAGWLLTDGRFDPTVLPALERWGYDRDFASGAIAVPGPVESHPSPGCGGIVLHPDDRAVTVPAGVSLDLGGVGKGVAADLVAAETVAAGASGICVNLGGDVRVEGDPPTASGWTIELQDPHGRCRPLGRARLRHGAVASSWRTRRTWGGAREERAHHLIDPSTGAPAWSGLAGVCVVAREAWIAEVLAKAAFVEGPDAADVVARHGAAGILVTDDGRSIPVGNVEAFLA